MSDVNKQWRCPYCDGLNTWQDEVCQICGDGRRPESGAPSREAAPAAGPELPKTYTPRERPAETPRKEAPPPEPEKRGFSYDPPVEPPKKKRHGFLWFILLAALAVGGYFQFGEQLGLKPSDAQKPQVAVQLSDVYVPKTGGPSASIDVVSPGKDFYYLDKANVLSEAFEGEIYFANQMLYEETGAQFVVVTIDSTGGTPIESYASELFRQWGIGDGEKNNGLLLLMAIDDEQYYAMRGPGLNDVLPDAKLAKYLDLYLEDCFAAKQYEKGAKRFFETAFTTLSKYYGANANVFTAILRYNEHVSFGNQPTPTPVALPTPKVVSIWDYRQATDEEIHVAMSQFWRGTDQNGADCVLFTDPTGSYGGYMYSVDHRIYEYGMGSFVDEGSDTELKLISPVDEPTVIKAKALEGKEKSFEVLSIGDQVFSGLELRQTDWGKDVMYSMALRAAHGDSASAGTSAAEDGSRPAEDAAPSTPGATTIWNYKQATDAEIRDAMSIYMCGADENGQVLALFMDPTGTRGGIVYSDEQEQMWVDMGSFYEEGSDTQFKLLTADGSTIVIEGTPQPDGSFLLKSVGDRQYTGLKLVKSDTMKNEFYESILRLVHGQSASADASAAEDGFRLANGSRGDDVKALQQALIKLGYLGGGADGIFGKKTEKAVRDFQTANGLDATGVVTRSVYDRILQLAG